MYGQSLCTLGSMVASPIGRSKSITPVTTLKIAPGIYDPPGEPVISVS